MTKKRISAHGLLMAGAMGAGLLCGISIAKAQDYDGYRDGYYQNQPAPQYSNDYRDGYYQNQSRPDYGYRDRDYDRSAPETVIVHPYYDTIQKQQLMGTVDGEMNPVAVSASRPVSYSDLDLSRRADFREFRARVTDTARQLCREVGHYRDVDLINDGGDQDQCVRSATRDAMRQVGYPEG